jgi:hypothetical protein
MTGPTVGLIMSGGGARAAHQVGVLRAIGARVLSYLLFERGRRAPQSSWEQLRVYPWIR